MSSSKRGAKPIPVAVLRGHAAAVHGLSFLCASPQGGGEEEEEDDPESLFLAAGTSSGELKLWSLASRRPLTAVVASPAGDAAGKGTAAAALAAAAATGSGEAALVAKESICGVLGISSLGSGEIVSRASTGEGGEEELHDVGVRRGDGSPNLAVQRRSGAIELYGVQRTLMVARSATEPHDDSGFAYAFGAKPRGLILTGGFGFCRAHVSGASSPALSLSLSNDDAAGGGGGDPSELVRAVGAGAETGELRSFLWGEGGKSEGKGKGGSTEISACRAVLCASGKAALGRDLGMLMCVKRIDWLSRAHDSSARGEGQHAVIVAGYESGDIVVFSGVEEERENSGRSSDRDAAAGAATTTTAAAAAATVLCSAKLSSEPVLCLDVGPAHASHLLRIGRKGGERAAAGSALVVAGGAGDELWFCLITLLPDKAAAKEEEQEEKGGGSQGEKERGGKHKSKSRGLLGQALAESAAAAGDKEKTKGGGSSREGGEEKSQLLPPPRLRFDLLSKLRLPSPGVASISIRGSDNRVAAAALWGALRWSLATASCSCSCCCCCCCCSSIETPR